MSRNEAVQKSVQKVCSPFLPHFQPVFNQLPGALVSGKGTRFILANTEQLHEKVHDMSDRIRQLEDALQILQSRASPEPHPLLSPDLLTVKSTMGLYGGTQVGSESSASPPHSANPPGPMEVDRNNPEEKGQIAVTAVRTPSYLLPRYIIDMPFIREFKGAKRELRGDVCRGVAVKQELPIARQCIPRSEPQATRVHP